LDAVFDNRRNYVIFGLRHSGKTTLLGVLGGTIPLTDGHVTRIGMVSPIIGNPTILTTARTTADLVEIYAALYRADPVLYRAFVQEYGVVAGRLAQRPVLKLPPDVRRSLAFALSYGVPAEWYLFDGYVGPSGDSVLAKWTTRAFEHRKANSATIYITSTTRNASRFGDIGGVLHNGRLVLFDDLEQAVDAFNRIQGIAPKGPGTGRGLDPKNHSVELTRAKALASSGDIGGAIGTLKALQTEGALEPDQAYALARMYEQRGEWDSAISSARSVLKLAPAHKGAMVLLARSLEKKMDFKGALEFWEAAAAGSDRSGDYLPVFRNHAKQGNWALALSTITRARDLNSTDSGLMVLHLRALVELKRFQEFKDLLLPLAVLDSSRAVSVLSWTLHRLDIRTLGEVVRSFGVLGLLGHLDTLTREKLGVTLERHSRQLIQKGDSAISELLLELKAILAESNAAAAGDNPASGEIHRLQ
jgi:capsular polysaccharide transport system ATP-binding protein